VWPGSFPRLFFVDGVPVEFLKWPFLGQKWVFFWLMMYRWRKKPQADQEKNWRGAPSIFLELAEKKNRWGESQSPREAVKKDR
jgi:hypothetical protein